MIFETLWKLFPEHHRGFPVMGSWPIVGHLPSMFFEAPAVLATGAEYLGPMFWVHLGFNSRYLACMAPEAFELLNHDDTSNACFDTEIGGMFRNTLFAQYGPNHARVRSVLKRPFSPRGLTETRLGEETQKIFETITAKWVKDGSAKVLPDAREATLRVMFRILGVGDEDFGIWRRHYEDFLQLAYAIPWDFPGSPTRTGRKAEAWIGERIREIVDACAADPERPSNPENRSFIARIVFGKDERGKNLSYTEVINNVRGLLFAGYDTTSCVLSWLVVYLAHYPTWWERLVGEAASASGPPQNPRDLKKFPVAEALFREVLRLNPPFFFYLRLAEKEIVLLDKKIPRGVTVLLPVYWYLRNPEHYPEPNVFRPERWLDGAKRPGVRYENAAFSVGSHFCLGYHLAYFELVQFAVILANTMRAAGLHPRLTSDALPAPRYFPLLHPGGNPKVQFLRDAK